MEMMNAVLDDTQVVVLLMMLFVFYITGMKFAWSKWTWIVYGVYTIVIHPFDIFEGTLAKAIALGAYLLIVRFVLLYRLGPWFSKRRLKSMERVPVFDRLGYFLVALFGMAVAAFGYWPGLIFSLLAIIIGVVQSVRQYRREVTEDKRLRDLAVTHG